MAETPQSSQRPAGGEPPGQPARPALPPQAGQPAARPKPLPRPVPLPPAASPQTGGTAEANGAPAASRPAASSAGLPPASRPQSPRPAPLPPGAAGGPRPIPLDRQAAEPAMPRERPEEEPPPEEKLTRFAIRNSPPVLVSLTLHMLLIIILGLWYIVPRSNDSVQIIATYSDELGIQLDDQILATNEIITSDMSPVLSELPPLPDPAAALPDLAMASVGNVIAGVSPSKIIGFAAGRDAASRAGLLGKYGGTHQSEDAVIRGLEWLARNQRADGAWSLQGPYPDGSSFENVEAATAMALLAFLGNGHTHRYGQHARTVERGIKSLLRVQGGDGNFFKGQRRDEWLYTQAQCTIVFCELFAMTQDSQYKEPAERAVKFCVEAQDDDETTGGGWRYRPRSDSDLSVTGWMAMALQSAKNARIEVEQRVFDRISHFLDTVQEDGGAQYCYMKGQPPDEVMTAEGLLCRQYLGWAQDDERLIRGCEYLLQKLPGPRDPAAPDVWNRDVYYWYYGTQVMHHMEGKYWEAWNGVMRDHLVNTQLDKGPHRGSWDPMGKDPDRWCQLGHGGRLYVTCLSIYMLEVYYRHLPLYSDLKKVFEGTP